MNEPSRSSTTPPETPQTPPRTPSPSNTSPSRASPTNWTGGWILGGLLFVLGAGIGAVGIRPFVPGKSPETERDEAKAPGDPLLLTFSEEKQEAAGIETAPAVKRPHQTYTWRTGRIALHDDRIAHICPAVEGIVRETPVRLGQTVAAGEVLAVLESRELGQARLEAYKARMVLQAEREVASRTKTAMANAQYLLKLLDEETPLTEIEKRMQDRPIGEWRQQLLSGYSKRKQLKAQLAAQKSSGGAIPEATLLRTETDLDGANASYTALTEELRFQVKNQVRQADLKLRDAEMQFDITRAKLVLFGLEREEADRTETIEEARQVSSLRIKAPFGGTIVEKHAVRSERVGPQTQMFVLADLSSVWVHTDLFETDLPLLRDLKNHTVPFRAPVAGIAERTARVTYTGDLIDKSSRALTVIAEAPNPERNLKPGMFVEVGFATGEETPLLQLPGAAILRQEDKTFVFVQIEHDRFRRVEVTVGRTVGDQVEIRAGLKPGDRVVVKGAFILKSELLKDQMVGE